MTTAMGVRRWAAVWLCGVGVAAVGGCAAPVAETPGVGPGSELDRAITLLQVQFRSSDPAARANCIEALQPSTDPRAEDVIEQGLHDPEWVVRFAAAMATGKRKTPGYLPVLENLAAKDPNDSVKAGAIYALRQLGHTEHMNELVATLHSSDPAARANTAYILGIMGDPSAISLLRSIHTEPLEPVRFEITAALARLGDPQAKKIILSEAMSKYADDQYSTMMVCADLPDDTAATLLMGLMDVPANVPAREKAIATELTTRRQLVAARALGIRGSTQGLRVAEENCRNPDPQLRALAAMALGEMIHGTGVRVLAPMLKDPDPRVQRAAAEAIVNVESRALGGK